MGVCLVALWAGRFTTPPTGRLLAVEQSESVCDQHVAAGSKPGIKAPLACRAPVRPEQQWSHLDRGPDPIGYQKLGPIPNSQNIIMLARVNSWVHVANLERPASKQHRRDRLQARKHKPGLCCIEFAERIL